MIRQLNLNNYETKFILGNNKDEKLEKRPVVINISFRFLDDISACYNDDVSDTVCYSSLLNFLEKKLENTDFNLVERAAQYIYDAVSEYIKNERILKRVEVIKPDPPQKNLKISSFVCSDWE